jgi:beta-galactosidase
VGKPARLLLTPDHRIIHAEQGDLSYVTVEVVDEDGLVHPTASDKVYFTVKGVGSIAAVGNSDPTSTEAYRGNQRSLYRGRCLVVLKPDGRPGEISLRAQADGLDGAEVTIHTM